MGAQKDEIAVIAGRVIRKARKALPLTQEQLAERAGCSAVYVSNIETGLYQPSLEMILTLEGALELEPGSITQRTRAALPSRRRRGRAKA